MSRIPVSKAPPEPNAAPNVLVRGPAIFVTLLALVASGLLLTRLSDGFLWQDEAQTALISGTILERGVPYGHDGRNYFSQELGAEYGRGGIWRWHTWLPFYAVAASFALFGETTLAARLPFALAGIATILLSYFFAATLWRDRRAGVATSLLLLLSVPFFVLSRQARYYSFAALFSTSALHGYARLLDRERYAAAQLIASIFLLFHTHYLYAAALVAGCVLHGLLFARDAMRRICLTLGVAVLSCLPWIIWFSELRYAERYGAELIRLDSLLARGGELAAQLHRFVLPAPLLALLLVAMLTRFVTPGSWQRLTGATAFLRARQLCIPAFFALSSWVALSLTAPDAFFRYLAPLIPSLLTIAGGILLAAYRLHPLAVVPLLLLVLDGPGLMDVRTELQDAYRGPIEAMVEFLDQNAEPDDIVAVTYGDLPLKFYTDLRVVGALTGEPVEHAREARWLIIRKHVVSGKEAALRGFLSDNFPARQLALHPLDAIDLRFQNREDPVGHQFRRVEEGPPLVIAEVLKKKAPP